MSIAQSSLRAFLSTSKKSLASTIANKSPINLVVGNESADLDSITSSIVFAYLRSTAAISKGQSRIYVPLLNIPAADISIRPELLTLLPHANIQASHLITLDDISPFDTQPKLDPELTRWLLVDHNVLQGRLGELYGSRVVGCIDHHEDEQNVPQDTGDEPRVITKSGSCTSLIVNHFRSAWDSLTDSSSASNTAQGQGDANVGFDDEAVRRTWDAQVAKFAMASILIDTSNLTSKDKVTEHDQKAVRYLEAKIALAPRMATFDRKPYYDELNKAKKDLDALSLQDILRKDFKLWVEDGRRLGVSSVVKPLAYLEQKTDGKSFEEELDLYAKERKLDIVTVMTTSKSEAGEFQRELLLRIIDPDSHGMLEKFESIAPPELQLEPSDTVQIQQSANATKVWRQLDTSKSRKQVAPILREACKL